MHLIPSRAVAGRRPPWPLRQLAALLIAFWLPVCPNTAASPALNMAPASLPDPASQLGIVPSGNALASTPAAALLSQLLQLQVHVERSPADLQAKGQLQQLWQQTEAQWLVLFRQGQDRQLNRLYNQLQISWQLYLQQQPQALRQQLPLVQQQLREMQQRSN